MNEDKKDFNFLIEKMIETMMYSDANETSISMSSGTYKLTIHVEHE